MDNGCVFDPEAIDKTISMFEAREVNRVESNHGSCS